MPSFFAFLHHVAAFALVAALVLEFVLIRDELTLAGARRLRAADAVFGLSAGVVLAVGLLRVFYFEKGVDYYLHSAPFHAKVSLFFLIAILSIYPTVVFLSWKRPLAQGQIPHVAPAKLRSIRALLHFELIAVILLILCAALMARGVGSFG
jgi:putative membrane protein